MSNAEFIEVEGYSIRCQKTSVKGKEYQRFVVDFGKDADGKRYRRSFADITKAKKAIREHLQRQKKEQETQTVLHRRIGEKADKLNPDALLDAASAIEVLAGTASLLEAAIYFKQYHSPKGGKLTVREAIEEYVKESEQDNLRPASLHDMKHRLKRFCDAFGDKCIANMRKAEILEWSRGKHTAKRDGTAVSSLTRKNYLTVVGGLFNFALDNEYIAANPLESKTNRRRKKGGIQDVVMPEIITPKQVEAIMRAAQSGKHFAMVPALAIGFFAGVRTTELQQLDWTDVNLKNRTITINPRIAKKRSVRHIDISDNLAAWLAPYSRESGRIAPVVTAWRYHFDHVRTDAGMDRWPHNGMRHSFATYYLLKSNDQNKTALQLGHRDTNLLYNHYRGLATAGDAAAFWAIMPEVHEGEIMFRIEKAG